MNATSIKNSVRSITQEIFLECKDIDEVTSKERVCAAITEFLEDYEVKENNGENFWWDSGGVWWPPPRCRLLTDYLPPEKYALVGSIAGSEKKFRQRNALDALVLDIWQERAKTLPIDRMRASDAEKTGIN